MKDKSGGIAPGSGNSSNGEAAPYPGSIPIEPLPGFDSTGECGAGSDGDGHWKIGFVELIMENCSRFIVVITIEGSGNLGSPCRRRSGE